MERLIKLARQTKTKQGRANDDRRGFVESIVLSDITTPPSSTDNNEGKNPSKTLWLRLVEIPISTGIKNSKTRERISEREKKLVIGLE